MTVYGPVLAAGFSAAGQGFSGLASQQLSPATGFASQSFLGVASQSGLQTGRPSPFIDSPIAQCMWSQSLLAAITGASNAQRLFNGNVNGASTPGLPGTYAPPSQHDGLLNAAGLAKKGISTP